MRACDHLPARFNAAAWFVGRHADAQRDRIALITDGERWTYGDLDEAVRRFAARLLAAGLHAGDRIALVLPDTPALAAAFWGAMAAGMVAVPLNTMLKAGDYANLFADCDPRVIVVDPRFDEATRSVPARALHWSATDATADAGLADYADTHRDGFAFFLYSSGTTGAPKGVVHLHHDMWICAETYGHEILQIQPHDRCLSIAKIFFAYGLGNSLYFPAHVAASSVLVAERPLLETILAAVARHQPTLFFGVPTAYANLLAAMEAGAAYDFSSVRLCASAGEALPGSILERWKQRTGVDIVDGIGSTEVAHIFLSNRAGACKPGSTGTPVRGYDLRLVDADGNDVADGARGELLVRGDSTAAFYWNQHEASKRTFVGEWIRTGDQYTRDADGFYFHAGRSDDMIKAGGIWVSPVEVEAVLMAHAAVLECAVVGVPDASGLEKPHAFVTLRAEAQLGDVEVELRAFAKQQLAPYKVPHHVRVVDELPKTATGKIQRFRLRRA